MNIGWHSVHVYGCDCCCCPGVTSTGRHVASVAWCWRTRVVVGDTCCRSGVIGFTMTPFSGQIGCGIGGHDLSEILSSKLYNKIFDERAFFANRLFAGFVFRRAYCTPSRFGPHLYYLSRYFFNVHLLKCNRNILKIRSACTDWNLTILFVLNPRSSFVVVSRLTVGFLLLSRRLGLLRKIWNIML